MTEAECQVDETFGEQVRVWRRQNGLRRTELAAKIGVSAETLGRIERDQQEPSPPVRILLEQLLGGGRA